MGNIVKLVGAALALATSIAPLSAQVVLPEIDVSWTRLNSGMVGTSNSVITSRGYRAFARAKLARHSVAANRCTNPASD